MSGFAELRAALAASNLRAWQHDGFPGIRETMLDDGFTNSAAHLAALATRDAPALLAALDAAEADAARWRDRERANQLRAAQSAYSLTHCEGCDDPATSDDPLEDVDGPGGTPRMMCAKCANRFHMDEAHRDEA